MAYSANAPRRVVIRANKETLALVCGACALTFAIAYGVHGRPVEAPSATRVASSPPQQDWTGHLAEVPANATVTTGPAEPMSSDSLTVPKAQLALPAMPAKPKGRPCEAGPTPCPVSKAAVPVPPVRRQAAMAATTVAEQAKADRERGLMSMLNPLNHLPDVSTIKRPFAYAGDTVSGWFKRF